MRRTTIGYNACLHMLVLLVCFAASGCLSKSSRTESREQKPPSPTPASENSYTGSSYDFFHKRHPSATVLHPLDTQTLTESQIKFGIAPRRDPSIEYQPDVILMESGDKAIESIASDGLTWTFDANAPQVSEFEIGKIVFATGRAVGRVFSLKRQGDTVQVVLGPVELTDLIRNGTFEVDAAVDVRNAISYVAPNYPQPSDEDQNQMNSSNHAPPVRGGERVALAGVSMRGRYTEAGMRRLTDGAPSSVRAHLLKLSTNANGPGPRFLRTTGQSVQVTSPATKDIPQVPDPKKEIPQAPDLKKSLPKPPSVRQGTGQAPQVLGVPLPSGQNVPGVRDAPYGPSLHLPGIPGVEGISPLKIVEEPFDPPNLKGQVPMVELAGGKAIPLNGSDTSVGMEYLYDRDGLHVLASGKLILGQSHLKFFLHINNGGVEDCGVSLEGNMAVQLRLNARSLDNFTKNFHKTLYLPIDISVPMGGPVPLSLTFTSNFVLRSAFSAKGSVLDAKGDYSFGAGMDAGYWNNAWRFNAGADVKGDTNIADTVEGISVGWNSAVLGFGERALVGVGAFGMKAGVFIGVRFAGSVVKGPNITFPCRQGTMSIGLDTGVGYSIAEWLKNAINFFLKPLTDKTVDRAGTFLRGPVKQLYDKTTQIPENCIAR